jgi:hypothetical protein
MGIDSQGTFECLICVLMFVYMASDHEMIVPVVMRLAQLLTPKLLSKSSKFPVVFQRRVS